MDGLLDFPVTTAPTPGEVVPIAPGVLWLRMKLPFALNHINLWLVEDGDHWTAVDTGFSLPETREAWEHIFATHLGGRRIGRVIVTHFHPDHAGNSGWISERWGMLPLMTQAEWYAANLAARDTYDDSVARRVAFFREHGLDEARVEIFRNGVTRNRRPSTG